MTLPTPSAAPTPAGQPADPGQAPAATQAPGSQQETPKYVTEEKLAEAIEKGFRRAQQSAADRTRTIETKVQELTNQVGKLTTVTPEMQAKMVAQVTAEVDEQLQAPAQAPADDATAPGSGNPVYDWTMDFYKEEGLAIEQADPEFATIKAALDDPAGSMVKYQRTVMKSIQAKRTRLETSTETADARTIGSGKGSSGVIANSSQDYWNQARP